MPNQEGNEGCQEHNYEERQACDTGDFKEAIKKVRFLSFNWGPKRKDPKDRSVSWVKGKVSLSKYGRQLQQISEEDRYLKRFKPKPYDEVISRIHRLPWGTGKQGVSADVWLERYQQGPPSIEDG